MPESFDPDGCCSNDLDDCDYLSLNSLPDDYFWDYYETTDDVSVNKMLHMNENVQFVAVLIPILVPIDKTHWEKFADVSHDPILSYHNLLSQYSRKCDVIHATHATKRDHLQQNKLLHTEELFNYECREESNREKRKISNISSDSKFSYASDSSPTRSELADIPIEDGINENFSEFNRSRQSGSVESFVRNMENEEVIPNEICNAMNSNSSPIFEKIDTSTNEKSVSDDCSSAKEFPAMMNLSQFRYSDTKIETDSVVIENYDEDSTHFALDSIEEFVYVPENYEKDDLKEIMPSSLPDKLKPCICYINNLPNVIGNDSNSSFDGGLTVASTNESLENHFVNGTVNECMNIADNSLDTTSEGSESNIFSVYGENEKNTSSTIIICEVTGKAANQHSNTANITCYDQTLPADIESNHTKVVGSTMKQEMLIVDTCIGGAVSSQQSCDSDENAKFKSLVMISPNLTSNFVTNESSNNSVQIVSTDTSLNKVRSVDSDAVVVQPKNWQPRCSVQETSRASTTVKSIIDFFEEIEEKVHSADESSNSAAVVSNHGTSAPNKNQKDDSKEISMNDVTDANEYGSSNNIRLIANSKHENGKSSVASLEEGSDGLADDDSWVENISHHDSEEMYVESGSDYDSSEELILQNNAADREEELRGYNRMSIDFTLHTIVEESCEESEYESTTPQRVSASDLEKYFFFGLGEETGLPHNHDKSLKNYEDPEDSQSETSSVCSEGLNSSNENETFDETESNLTSSRLEKYFLSGFMGFSAEDSNNSNDSGSVGSDSEGKHSPEQRRKKLVRARGSSRSSQSSSLDNLLSKEDSTETFGLENPADDSSETDTNSECTEKVESNSDTIKRKKKLRKSDVDDKRNNFDGENSTNNYSDIISKEDRKALQKIDLASITTSLSFSSTSSTTPKFHGNSSSQIYVKKQNSRDSGFVGSNDDLLKNDTLKVIEKKDLQEIQEDPIETENDVKPKSGLSRKDSFTAWSSDEETNLMMSKMRQFFKTLVAASSTTRDSTNFDRKPVDDPSVLYRSPQLVYFENELTRLMKTVPGIKDEHVREIVEYFSSEDTWSDSYDSSDYTSSDKETIIKHSKKIQQQISERCQEIIEKFDGSKVITPDEEGDMGDGGLIDDGLNKETAFVYQKLIASISKIQNEKKTSPQGSSPPFIAKVLHHIGSRLEALMHEVSSSDSMKSSTTEVISGVRQADENRERSINNLGRSRSHDLLLSEGKITPEVVLNEERETSDNERFSWRGSFESALLADSSQKLCSFENSSSSALSVLIAKRRSVGDLLFSSSSLSNEQLDRVRSCGSIDGDRKAIEDNDEIWKSTDDKNSSGFNKNEDNFRSRSTLPRILQLSINNKATNSLPRLPVSFSSPSNNQTSFGSMQKAQSVYNFLHNNVKSARYRPPGFNRQPPSKRNTSAKSQTISYHREHKGIISECIN